MNELKHYFLADDCPNCGQKDSEWAWKGARMSSTKWKHNYSCCSDKCGYEFFGSPTHRLLEREKIKREIQILQSRLSELEASDET